MGKNNQNQNQAPADKATQPATTTEASKNAQEFAMRRYDTDTIMDDIKKEDTINDDILNAAVKKIEDANKERKVEELRTGIQMSDYIEKSVVLKLRRSREDNKLIKSTLDSFAAIKDQMLKGTLTMKEYENQGIKIADEYRGEVRKLDNKFDDAIRDLNSNTPDYNKYARHQMNIGPNSWY